MLVTAFRADHGGSAPIIALLVALAVTVVVLLVMERWKSARMTPRAGVEELIRAGESAQVEFKSSARFNRHTGTRDEKIERVIAKTVAAFLNAEGGVLLIGVTDDGEVCGLADDYVLMKAPDNDRFELWLRDMLVASIGATETARVGVEFETVRDAVVCVVRVPAARRPVFLRPTKGDAAPVFVVRIGNSTRELAVDQTLSYCVDRWGRSALRSGAR